ncbi:DNA binding protein [Phytophthora megakarya]|uniref:DNA binding protein n=1 Tax=Phytophthora megakarya TaxID=4795 RepID=A0A225UBB4_9STRA|nr:DNA binding protein [Phytophthora megakarya]
MWCCRATGKDTNTGVYIAEMIGDVIGEIEKEFGKGKVVSITTDNASSMQSAWTIFETTRPGFMATDCAAHALSLLVKDVLVRNTMKTILREATEISFFIRSNTAMNS